MNFATRSSRTGRRGRRNRPSTLNWAEAQEAQIINVEEEDPDEAPDIELGDDGEEITPSRNPDPDPEEIEGVKAKAEPDKNVNDMVYAALKNSNNKYVRDLAKKFKDNLETERIYSTEYHTARKRWICSKCNSTIAPGIEYKRVVYKENHGFSEKKFCLKCGDAQNKAKKPKKIKKQPTNRLSFIARLS